jgi:hypothetical protein
MVWGRVAAVPALGFWSALILGALIGVAGVRLLRGVRPRRVAMIILAVAVLIPITVRAVPFTFTNGTVADATQVNANFAAVTPVTGFFSTQVNGALVTPADILTPSFVAPRALTCVVHLDARMFLNTGTPAGTDQLSAIKRENGTTSLAFAPPANGSIPTELGPNGSSYTASQTRLFTVANGATIQFGCRLDVTGSFATGAAVTQCTTVYECY